MCLLANASDCWLMYLREAGDAGLSSRGDPTRPGNVEFQLTNGQVDQYPLAWCLPRTRCYAAVLRFFLEGGCRLPDGIAWHED